MRIGVPTEIVRALRALRDVTNEPVARARNLTYTDPLDALACAA